MLERILTALLLSSTLAGAAVHVDGSTSTFRDGQNRTLLWHGINFVEKGAPFYPNVTADTVADLRAVGASVVRLGVMMSGMYPMQTAPDAGPDPTYWAAITAIIDLLHTSGIATIIDLHQDVLARKICGEGLPDWMVDVAALCALPIPMPLTLNASKVGQCTAVGPLKFIGWSELYMTDACGKAFGAIFDGTGTLGSVLERYWGDVSKALAGHPGVLAYELMNEPWVGDWFPHNVALLTKAGEAERATVGPWMSRMHRIVRANDPNTTVLFAPAEINNRFMRPVGFEKGFLGDPGGAAMAFHTYCVIGTDGPGPTTPVTQELCHVNDGLQLGNRDADLMRLQTAGFVTEFGGVSDVATGRAEVRYVAEKLDAMTPPSSWAFWAGVPSEPAYRAELARSYPRATAGDIVAMSFDAGTSRFALSYQPLMQGGRTELFLSSALHYPHGWDVALEPMGCCTTTAVTDGLLIDVPPFANTPSSDYIVTVIVTPAMPSTT